MPRILFVFLTGLIFPVLGEKAVIKGKQYVRHTTTARLIGGPVPQEIIDYLTSDSTELVFSPNPSPPLGVSPVLITEDVKTVVTRMSIPLNSSYHDNERYMSMLKKFLVNNKVDLSATISDTGDQVLGISEIENNLHQALVVRGNLNAALREVLVKHADRIPKGNHAPLSHIFRLIQLGRIPLVDLVATVKELSTLNAQEQGITILIEIERLIPAYMKSCVTYLLESLQTGNLDITTVSSGASLEKILAKDLDRKKISPLSFPKQLIQQIPESHVEELGESTAALLTTVRGHGQMTPKLLRYFLATVPRNTVSSEEENQVYYRMNRRVATEDEKKIVEKAAKKSFEQFDKPPSRIFQAILTQIAAAEFEGVQDYKIVLRLFQIPRENYIVS